MCELWLLTGKLFTRGVKRGVSQKTGSDSGLFLFHFQVWVGTDTLFSGPFFSLGVDMHAHTHSHHGQPTLLKCMTISIGTGNRLWVDVLKITTCSM